MFKQYRHQLSIFFFILLTAGIVKTVEMDSLFTPTPFIVRYWNRQITNNLPKPSFLLSKSSPLTIANITFFNKLVVQNSLSSNLYSFCATANLYCFPESYNHFQNIGDLKVEHVDPIRTGYGGDREQSRSFYYGVDVNDHDTFRYGEKTTLASSPIAEPTSWVEPGIFFHESLLKEGSKISMPDIRDTTPKRSFLPRLISSKLPFSNSRLSELKQIFHVRDNSSMDGVLKKTLEECERPGNDGETKKCVGSIEDMIDFVVSILGHNVTVISTINALGSKHDVMIGSVREINVGGKVTESVSCHNNLFPYMVYLCHSVPKTRVYEAEILDVKNKEKINKGVAICHLNTTAWRPSHMAFVALGSTPGKTEVCHWIFENDMIWTVAE